MVLPMTFMTSTKMVDLGAEGEKVHWSIYRDSTLGAFYLPHSLPTKLFGVLLFWYLTIFDISPWRFRTDLVTQIKNLDFFICLVFQGPQERCWICLSSPHNHIDSLKISSTLHRV